MIAPSFWVRGELERYGFEADVRVIYTSPPQEIQILNQKASAREVMRLPGETKVILSVSSNLRRKNIPVIREIMKLLGDSYRLVKVGSPVDDAINFNYLTAEKINLLYNVCDALLFPTLGEGYGKPVVEAFVSGLPVVAS